MMRMPFLHRARRSALKMCFVSGVDGMCSDMIVGALAQLVQRDELDAELTSDLCADERIVRDERHLERPRAPRHFLADAAEAGKPQHLAAHFFTEKTLLVPLPLFHRAVGGGNLSGKCQYLSQRQFGDADAVGPGRVHDDNAARAGGVDVDVVHAGARRGQSPGAPAPPQSGRRSLSWRCARPARRPLPDRLASSGALRPLRASTSQPSERSNSMAETGSSSATTIFIE